MKKLKPKKKREMHTLAVRVPLNLYESLNAFKKELQQFDETMIFDVSELVTVALRRDLRVAREELDQLKQVALKPPPVRQSTVTPAPTDAGNSTAPAEKPATVPPPASAALPPSGRSSG